MWPAFWLYCRSPNPWPPEIDVFEFFTTPNTNKFSSTVHWGKDVNGHHPMDGRDHSVCKPAEYFRIYACEWTPTEIRFYYDNLLIRTTSNGIGDFIYPMHVIVNSAVQTGPNLFPQNSTFPNYFEVDYVRCYTR
jgi:beta-glucanase (GH16 family)